MNILQLPVPGREAFWDMDTPETKKSGHFIWCLITPSIPRFRESLYSTDSLLEEPELHLDASPTLDAKLKLKPRRRLEQVSENKVLKKLILNGWCLLNYFIGCQNLATQDFAIPGQGGGICPGEGDEVVQRGGGGGGA